MSPVDNNLQSDAKRQGQSLLASQSSRTAEQYKPLYSLSRGSLSALSSRPSRRTMHGFAFVPRPFPPPALADVPVEYIIDQLRHLAPHYWSKPETSDCTIVIPLDPKATAVASGQSTDIAAERQSAFASLTFGQETEESLPRPAPRMVMQLHMDYLCAHSTLLRGLLSGASPFDLIEGPPLTSNPPLPVDPLSQRASVAAPLFPSILPSSPTHPSIYMPVPDPASFRLLVHYIYFGCTSFIEDALDDGKISWEGLARNVEYLGMGSEIKVFLGHWYRCWRHGREFKEYDGDSDSQSDLQYDSGSDTDQELDLPPITDSTATSPTVVDPDETYYKDDDGGKPVKSLEPTRGRNRVARRLGHSSSDPGLGSSRQKGMLRALRGCSK